MLLERGCIRDGKMGGQICKEGLPGFDEVFGSVVVVAVPFQITFCAEMHVNDVFFIFLKIIFDISTSKQSKTYKTY
jgi:hypothetical protein